MWYKLRKPRHSPMATPMLNAPISEADLTAYLRESDNNFRFEMAVFKSCLDHGFNAEHGGHYTDPATKKNRQFDIRAQLERTQYAKQRCILRLAVECKNLKQSFPLLVSCVPRRIEESYHAVLFNGIKRSLVATGITTTGVGDQTTSKSSTSTATQITTEAVNFQYTSGSLFQAHEPVGKSTTQVGKILVQQRREEKNEPPKTDFVSNDEEVHEKWLQAIASAYDLIEDSQKDYDRREDEIVVTVVLPILVVADNTLWAVEYSALGSIHKEPTSVEGCTLYFGKKVGGPSLNNAYKISHLLIYTETGFGLFLDDLILSGARNGKSWDRIFPARTIAETYAELSAQKPFGLDRFKQS